MLRHIIVDVTPKKTTFPNQNELQKPKGYAFYHRNDQNAQSSHNVEPNFEVIWKFIENF